MIIPNCDGITASSGPSAPSDPIAKSPKTPLIFRSLPLVVVIPGVLVTLLFVGNHAKRLAEPGVVPAGPCGPGRPCGPVAPVAPD